MSAPVNSVDGPRSAPATPVVIIGNGPVGQTAALLLAHWELPVVLVDARPKRDPIGSKAICQHRDVLDIWDTVGAGRQIADEGVTWVRARTYHGDKELFCVEFAEQGNPAFPPFVNISQTRSEEILAEQIAANPLIEERWSTSVVEITQTDDEVTLACETPNGPSTLSAPYVVMATGSSSRELREQLGTGFPGRSFKDQFLICDVRCDLPGWADERRFYFDPVWNPGRQVLIHPCPDGTFRIDWQVPPDFDLEQAEASGEIDHKIRQIIGDEVPYEIVWHSLYRFHQRLTEHFVSGRVVLAGDCAHIVAPFGARGLNSGVADTENAAWKIAWLLRGLGGPNLLASYQVERYAAAQENLDVTGTTMEFLVPHSDEEHERRTSVLIAADTDPAMASRVDSGRLYEPFWYVDSPLTTPDGTRPPATRPERGGVPNPGVGVLVPDMPVTDPHTGARTRLRLTLRQGFTVLVNGPVPEAVADGAGVTTRSMADVHPDLATTLGARPGETWVVRPDAHVAAILPGHDLAAVEQALARAQGFQTTERPAHREATGLTRGRRPGHRSGS